MAPAIATLVPGNYDQSVIDSMIRKSVLSLTGASNIKDAWDSIFTYHNFRKSNQRKSYSPGETIFIKINQGTASWLYMNGTAYEAPDILPRETGRMPMPAPARHLLRLHWPLLRQLVNDYGIEQQDILIGDPISHIYKHNYDAWHAEFPDIQYIDQSADFGQNGYPSGRYGFNQIIPIWVQPCRMRFQINFTMRCRMQLI